MTKNIGGTPINPKHRATCHCGAVVLELDLPDGVVNAYRCNCSLCRRKGAIMGAVPLNALKLVQGESALKLYQFHTRAARHYFCGICGIYTHHVRRSDPNVYGYNVGCLEGVDPFQLDAVSLIDGANHPMDRKG